MTAGEQLLLACVKKKDSKVLSLVQRKWLDGSEVLQHGFIMEYYREHGEIVGVVAFCDKFKLDPKGVDSRPSFYLNEVKERYIFSVITDKVPRIIRGIRTDPRKRLSELQSIIATLSVDSVDSKDTLYSDDVGDRKKDYEERVKSSGVTYLSMGAEDMDKTFYGYRKQDLITIGGRAGAGKTWLLVYLVYILEKHLEKAEREGEILLISNEMGEEEIKERLDCIRFRLPYEKFLKGELTEREKARYYKGLDSLKTKKSRIRILYSCQTVDELSTFMGLYQPLATFIDGSYLMEGQMAEGWEKIVFITRNLKRISKNFKCPIINTTQLKRGTGKGGSKVSLDGQDDFAYSSSYSQDSDIAFRMYQDADMKYHDLVGVEVVKGRRVKAGTTILFENNLDIMNHSLTLPVDETPEPVRKTDY
jgi:replicative DNA helicase